MYTITLHTAEDHDDTGTEIARHENERHCVHLAAAKLRCTHGPLAACFTDFTDFADLADAVSAAYGGEACIVGTYAHQE